MRFEPGPDDDGARLDVFLSRRLSGWTRSQLQRLNARGGVRIDGARVKDGYRVRAGQSIAVDDPAPGLAGPEPGATDLEPVELNVLFEDAHIAVVEKPAGLAVHPGAGDRRVTLADALRARFPHLSDVGGAQRPGIVHRLDRWTSGLVVVAKSNRSHARLSESFRERTVRKSYIAAVHGSMARESGEIDLPIRRHPVRRTRMAANDASGRPAHTAYRTRDRASGFSLLDVTIRTGRTHQVRVHLAAVGHPVLGDAVYGARPHRAFERRYGPLRRYFLHAVLLAFPHPETARAVEFRSELPEELAALWRRIGTRT